MNRQRRLVPHAFHGLWTCGFCFFFLSCGLFEPRTPEPPSQSSLDFSPPTEPTIVIANLQAAIAQKSLANYTSCFSDPSRMRHTFVFIPSLFSPVFASWTRDDEGAYFQNLIASASTMPTAFSNLLLSLKSSAITSDSVVYNFDYTLTFEHKPDGFPSTVRGNLQFSLGTASDNTWAIYRWTDTKTTTDTTWSLLKEHFSNH